jgi:hypothetical protein
MAAELRRVLLVTHTGREHAVEVARQAHRLLHEAGIVVRLLAGEAEVLRLDPAEIADDPEKAALDTELIVVLGGDGSILRGAELARPHGTPLLGVNLGHVGFLAEAEREDLVRTVQVVVDRSYTVEERMTLDIDTVLGGERGERGEGGPGANARADGGGGRPAVVAVGLRRRRLRHPDRLHGVRVLGRRPGGLAGGRGDAGGAAQCARAVLPADGGGADLDGRDRAGPGLRRPRRAVV